MALVDLVSDQVTDKPTTLRPAEGRPNRAHRSARQPADWGIRLRFQGSKVPVPNPEIETKHYCWEFRSILKSQDGQAIRLLYGPYAQASTSSPTSKIPSRRPSALLQLLSSLSHAPPLWPSVVPEALWNSLSLLFSQSPERLAAFPGNRKWFFSECLNELNSS